MVRMPALRPSAFDGVPEIYDRARPRYPAQLYAALWEYIGSDAPLDIVEVGAGTGQATIDLLPRARSLVAIELGPNVAEFLAAKFANEARVRVMSAAFEDAGIPPGSCDLVASATAFHWVDPAVRMKKAHSLLRPGGTLAIVTTVQIESEVDRGYFERSFPVYARYWPEERPGRGEPEDFIPDFAPEMEQSGLFDDVRYWKYRYDQRYTTAQYLDLVRSYSNTNDLPADIRERFLGDLAAFIDAEFDGHVVRPLVIPLVCGRAR